MNFSQRNERITGVTTTLPFGSHPKTGCSLRVAPLFLLQEKLIIIVAAKTTAECPDRYAPCTAAAYSILDNDMSNKSRIVLFHRAISSLLIFCAVSCFGKNSEQKSAPLDHAAAATTLQLVRDTTVELTLWLGPDLPKAHIRYDVKGMDTNQPVSWSVTITVGMDTSYRDSGDSEWFDALIRESSDSTEIPEYQHWKQAWYSSDFYKPDIDTITIDDERRSFFQEINSDMTTKFLVSSGMDAARATRAVSSFWDFYSSRVIIGISIPTAPEGADPGLFAFHPELRKFVLIYAP